MSSNTSDSLKLQQLRDEAIARLVQQAEDRKRLEREEMERKDAELARELVEAEQKEIAELRRKEQMEIVVQAARDRKKEALLKTDEELARLLSEELEGDAPNSIDEDYLYALQLAEASNTDHHFQHNRPRPTGIDDLTPPETLNHLFSVYNRQFDRSAPTSKIDYKKLVEVHKTLCGCREFHVHNYQCCPVNHYHTNTCCRFLNPNYYQNRNRGPEAQQSSNKSPQSPKYILF